MQATPAHKKRKTGMGEPVVHFEVIGKDGERLRSYYSELFSWDFGDVVGPTNYAVVAREGNTNADGVGIRGGIGTAPEGYDGHVTFYVEVPDVEAALAKAESLGGTRMMGPDKIPEVGIEIGLFTDPEGHVIGVVK
jgi:predicted enzyme related to lactoylglutathione lyase